jgi:multisubunit Na+/H+ antiporter MnhG subunit
MLLIARIVRLAGSAAIALLLASIGIHLLDVGTGHGVTETLSNVAATLADPFTDVFLPADEKLRFTLNYALAAVVYGALAPLVAHLLARADEGLGYRRRARRA